MLHSIHLEEVSTMRNLTLDAPGLKKVRILNCFPLRLHLVHSESVERLLVDCAQRIDIKTLKNLRYLCADFSIDSTVLSSLEQLKELHVDSRYNVSRVFEHARANLKIYLWGLLMNEGPDDLQMENSF